MKQHTKNYLEAFYPDYEFDMPICEVCTRPGIDIHHLDSGRHKRSDHPALLMCLCRECHTRYGDRKDYISLLVEKHRQFLIRKDREEWIEMLINLNKISNED